jgi:hypothetical protein
LGSFGPFPRSPARTRQRPKASLGPRGKSKARAASRPAVPSNHPHCSRALRKGFGSPARVGPAQAFRSQVCALLPRPECSPANESLTLPSFVCTRANPTHAAPAGSTFTSCGHDVRSSDPLAVPRSKSAQSKFGYRSKGGPPSGQRAWALRDIPIALRCAASYKVATRPKRGAAA